MPRRPLAEKKKKSGRKAKGVVASGVDWESAVRHALAKRKPKGGWPKPGSAKK